MRLHSSVQRLALSSILLSAPVRATPPEPSFRVETIDSEVQIGYGIALADINGDGKPDILLADQHTIQWYENPTWKKHVMLENITERDNVCIAAQDINGDGKAEVAIGAQWNPGETLDAEKSGGVFYLLPPADRTQRWEAVKLHHEPTVHRMHWVLAPSGKWELIVKPLHGRGNRNNEGDGSKVFAYGMPENPRDPWTLSLVSDFTHASHNFHPINWDRDPEHEVLTAAREGVFWFGRSTGSWKKKQLTDHWAGEVRDGQLPGGARFLATIEPMHGNTVAFYTTPEAGKGLWKRQILDESLKDGHAAVVADFLGAGSDQILAGWRGMNPKGVPGVRMFTPLDSAGKEWRTSEVSGAAVAIEDIKSADLNGDGKPDLVLAGRQTKNLQILWNQTPAR
ncbi:MAG: Repeat domain-containing protein/FG-GAP repeat-containing protein [Verrucomicrobia bacterium]|nr:MAG: Repeat domain-containing protein/FG-GAP repeat-containing protein [Verrucomicrobiota bacterium]